MKVNLYYQLSVSDAKGKVIRKGRRRIARSWVKAYIDFVRIQIGATSGPMVDISNAAQTVGPVITNLNANGGAGDLTKGPVVGTGSTVVAISDYKLDVLVAHGSGAGQLEYMATPIVGATTVSAPDAYFTIQRVMVNNSGGDITLQEVGLYAHGDSPIVTFCVARDLVGGGGQLVPNLGSATLTYTIQITA